MGDGWDGDTGGISRLPRHRWDGDVSGAPPGPPGGGGRLHLRKRVLVFVFLKILINLIKSA